MSIAAQNIINQINLYVRQDPVRSYQNMRLNSILLQMVDFFDTGGGGTGATAGVLKITSANFINATDCPLIALDGDNLNVRMKGIGDLDDVTDFHILPGGGFGIDIPGFDATANSYTFYVQIQLN